MTISVESFKIHFHRNYLPNFRWFDKKPTEHLFTENIFTENFRTEHFRI